MTLAAGPRNAVRIGLLLGCLLVVASVLTLGAIPYVTREKKWSIGIYTGPSPFQLHSPRPGLNPVLTARDVTDVRARFVADPFMLRKDATWYLFFEVLNAATRRGEIGLATSSDAWQWTYRGIVLSEPFHLSYPYVFASGNDYYMVPESGEAGSIRLYKAVDFPTKWALVAPLLLGKPFADSSIVQFNGVWFMFTETRAPLNDTLGLYFASELQGPWQEHPQSPIVSGNPHISRPGGRVLQSEGKLFRFAQDDAPNYGMHVWAFEITDLTTARYQEHPVSDVPILTAGEETWNGKGMHQIDPHPIGDGTWIACVDGSQRYWGLGFYPLW